MRDKVKPVGLKSNESESTIWFDILTILSMIVIVPWTKSLEAKTYVSDTLFVLVIVVVGLIAISLRYYYGKDKTLFSWRWISFIIVADFLVKGIIVLCMIFSLNYYFRDTHTITKTKKIEDNFKKGPKGIRYVIISDPNKMINIGKDYKEYSTIELSLSKGLIGMDLIEGYKLN